MGKKLIIFFVIDDSFVFIFDMLFTENCSIPIYAIGYCYIISYSLQSCHAFPKVDEGVAARVWSCFSESHAFLVVSRLTLPDNITQSISPMDLRSS